MEAVKSWTYYFESKGYTYVSRGVLHIRVVLSPTFSFIVCVAFSNSYLTAPHNLGLDVSRLTQFQSLWLNSQQDDDCREWLCAPGDGCGLSPCQVRTRIRAEMVAANNSPGARKSSHGLVQRKGLTLQLRTNGHFSLSWPSQMVPMCRRTIPSTSSEIFPHIPIHS
jgi:hypothetical protein